MGGRRTIDILVDELTPVRRLKPGQGLALFVAAGAACALAVAVVLGLRDDLEAGRPHGMFLLRLGALLALALTAGWSARASARPGVGKRDVALWKASLALAALFPLGAMASAWLLMDDMPRVVRMLDRAYGYQCLQISMACGLIVGAAMVIWLRRGAPVDPERTGWLVGVASGSLGAAAYGMACSENLVLYIGTWYTLAVGLCALAGRLIVPRLLRW